MLNIFGPGRRFCDGVSRRDFLGVGALGLTGLALPELLQLRAQAAPARTAKSVIIVCLDGGPSQLDTWDMKPGAPAEVRGEFQPIRSRVPGFDVCELLPLHAQIADRLALVRSMTFIENNHDLIEVFSAFPRPAHRPAFGSIVSRLGLGNGALPRYLSLSGDRIVPESFENPSYVGAAHKPFLVGKEGVRGLELRADVNAARLNNRRQLLGALDNLRRDGDRLATMDAFTAQALDLVTSAQAREAFDISREPESVRSRYETKDGSFIYSAKSDIRHRWPWEKFLLARRLVEAGVPVVTMRVGAWDHHGDGTDSGKIYPSLRSELPLLDRSVHALLTDLHERGLDQEVGVLIWGEFGRSPGINKIAGRDHWTKSGCALFAGAGVKTGQVIGATDAQAAQPKTRPWAVQNVFAVLYHMLGIDPAQTLPDRTGRPMPLLDDTELISDLMRS